MLRYLSSGQRQFGDKPMPPHRRVNWEFAAVVKGKLAPTLGDGTAPELISNRLWIFPPTISHGWRGQAGRSADFVVFHFNRVSVALEDAVLQHGYLTVDLAASDKTLLHHLYKRLQPHYWQPVKISDVHADLALAELTLLGMRSLETAQFPVRRNSDVATVAKIEQWMGTNLAHRANVKNAAIAAGISESHLYRLFRDIRQMSPHEVIGKLRLDRAMEFMANGRTKLDAIAEQCGFSNASALCRAFKKHTGHTPRAWRTEVFIQYRPPDAAANGDHRSHGERLRAP